MKLNQRIDTLERLLELHEKIRTVTDFPRKSEVENHLRWAIGYIAEHIWQDSLSKSYD